MLSLLDNQYVQWALIAGAGALVRHFFPSVFVWLPSVEKAVEVAIDEAEVIAPAAKADLEKLRDQVHILEGKLSALQPK